MTDESQNQLPTDFLSWRRRACLAIAILTLLGRKVALRWFQERRLPAGQISFVWDTNGRLSFCYRSAAVTCQAVIERSTISRSHSCTLPTTLASIRTSPPSHANIKQQARLTAASPQTSSLYPPKPLATIPVRIHIARCTATPPLFRLPCSST